MLTGPEDLALGYMVILVFGKAPEKWVVWDPNPNQVSLRIKTGKKM